jgi:hypothetical protein
MGLTLLPPREPFVESPNRHAPVHPVEVLISFGTHHIFPLASCIELDLHHLHPIYRLQVAVANEYWT